MPLWQALFSHGKLNEQVTDMERDALWLWFTEVFGLSSNRTNNLLRKYNSIDGLFKIPEAVLMADDFLTLKEKKEIIMCNTIHQKRRIKNLLSKGIHVISIENPLYPQILKNIANPPFVLFCAGNTESLNSDYPITMVGTRNPDDYGKKCARNISGELSLMGAIVISGLANGCDRECHIGALENDGVTIGVCACGINVDYPKGSAGLKREICKKGCIISEFPVGCPVRRQNFAVRNRILSGLSLATVVIQGTLKSGTMLTANHAISQDRDVYVLTGDPFNPLSQGPLSLLQEGASPFIESSAIIEHYRNIYKNPLILPQRAYDNLKEQRLPFEKNEKKFCEKKNLENTLPIKRETCFKDTENKKFMDDLPQEQKDILLLLREKPLQIDEMVAKTSLPSFRLLSILTELELFSYIKALPGGIYKALL